MVTETFTAGDIAERLSTLDADKPCREACKVMDVQRQDVASVRKGTSKNGRFVRLKRCGTFCDAD